MGILSDHELIEKLLHLLNGFRCKRKRGIATIGEHYLHQTRKANFKNHKHKYKTR